MEATDLMIGDLVINGGLYTKVIYIGQKISLYDGKGTEFTIDPCHVEPIKLTEEILVKNGFERSERWHYLTTKISNKKITIQLGCGGKIDYVRVLEQNEIQPFTTYYLDAIFSNIRYVHQLQHLLRLCGIEKELTI